MAVFQIYRGDRKRPHKGPTGIPTSRFFRQPSPECYLPSKELIDAVNVALHLGQPLLVTGEPGTGKTQLAKRKSHSGNHVTSGIGDPQQSTAV